MTPKTFNVATAEQDWAGEGRIIKAHANCVHLRDALVAASREGQDA